MPSSHLILCRPLLLLPPVPPSIRVFSNESTLGMRWPKYWSFSFSITPSKEIPGLIFRMDWLDLLAVQGTLRSLLQNHSTKAWVRVVWGNSGQGKWQRFLRGILSDEGMRKFWENEIEREFLEKEGEWEEILKERRRVNSETQKEW